MTTFFVLRRKDHFAGKHLRWRPASEGGPYKDEELLDFEKAEELGGGVGEAGAATGDDVEMAGDVELANLELFQGAVVDFPGDTHTGDDGDAHAHLHEALNAFDGRHFHGHVERRLMAREKLDDAAAEGRFDDVGDKVFLAKLLDIDLLLLGEEMLGRNDESEFVLENFGGLELRVTGHKGHRAEIEPVVHDFMGNIAGKHAVQADLDAGMGFAEFGDGRKESVDGAFVDAEGEFAALEALEVHQAFLDFVAQVEEALGVFAKEGAGVGEADGARAADEEGLAEGFFELADGQADRGLRAVKAFGGAREAALAGDGQKDLEFSEIHGSSPANTCSSGQASRRSVEILRRTKRSSG